ncbi:MAG: Rrf2 family transcriptional regulator [Actinobacteria bacterium]|nr:Rrf2 family transcriptional regulator [Actinomycetota bacterium]MBL7060462.1 Rrf2 family transcriptional regulator [Actinomycetota bacterium]
MVISRRGAKGGYVIAKPPGEIKLIQVINTLEGSISPVDCVDGNICKKASECVLYDVWKEIKDVIEKILSSITLKDLVDKYKNKKKRKK